MKRKFISMALAAAMVMGLAACGSDGAADNQSSTPTDSQQQTDTPSSATGDDAGTTSLNMVFAWWGNQTRNERTQAALDLYSEQNPGITFDAQPAAWDDYWAKLATSAAGSSLPDCLQMDYSYVAEYVANGQLMDLTPYVESGLLDVSNVDEGILESGSIDGKLYAVCAGVNAPSLFYNKTLLDELGITVKDCMTLEEFQDIARQVYEKSGVKTDVAYGGGDNFMPYTLRSNGTVQLFNEKSLNVSGEDAFVPYFSLYETGTKEGWILGADVFAELTVNSVEQSPLVYFSSPETQSWCGFYWSNQLTAMVGAAPEGMEIGITTWPAADPKASMFLKPSQFFSVSRDAKNPEEAVKVLNFFLNSNECNDILLGERGVPASSEVAAHIAPALDDVNKTVVDYINNVATPNCSPISPAVPNGANEVYDEADKLVDEVLYGQKTAAQASAELYAKGNEIMGR